MKEFIQVLRRFVPPYKKYLILHVVFNILSAVLNIFSFMLIVPILQILFKMQCILNTRTSDSYLPSTGLLGPSPSSYKIWAVPSPLCVSSLCVNCFWPQFSFPSFSPRAEITALASRLPQPCTAMLKNTAVFAVGKNTPKKHRIYFWGKTVFY